MPPSETGAPDLSVNAEFLERLLSHRAETDLLDHKGAMAWDDADSSASLTKDILAFANSLRGGWITIGVREEPKGVFNLDGLSPEQANSFETTKLAKWINARCDPPVRIEIYRHDVASKLFVIIKIAEFDEVPVVCTRDHIRVRDSKPLLRAGIIYTRNQNAECIPVLKGADLKPIIGAAVQKQQETIMTLIRSVIVGQQPAKPETVVLQVPPELEEMRSFVNSRVRAKEPIEQSGTWTMEFVPLAHRRDLFDGLHEGTQVLNSIATPMYGLSIPYRLLPVKAQTWGIGEGDGSFVFALSRSGTWVERAIRWTEAAQKGVVADLHKYGIGRIGNSEDGTYILYLQSVYETVCRFKLASKLAGRLNPDVPVRLSMHATGLNGRTLTSADPSVPVYASPCEAHEFDWSRDFGTAGAFIAGWQASCADMLFRFIDLMNAGISRQTLKSWVEKSEKDAR